MGAWGTGAFENDTACDWYGDLVDAEDLSLVQNTLSSVEDAEDDELDANLGYEALAACEVIARLQGRGGRKAEVVDQWCARVRVKPSPQLVRLATHVIDRLASDGSELAALWQGDQSWKHSVQDLRKRVAG